MLHIVSVSAFANELVSIPLQMIGKVCLYVDCRTKCFGFVANFPNMFKKD